MTDTQSEIHNYIATLSSEVSTLSVSMAEQQEAMKEEMEAITCRLCNKFLQEPKYLRCLHCYCRECIQKHVNCADQSFWCPACQTKVIISQSNACKLPAALTLDSMRELCCQLSQGEIECGLCRVPASENLPKATAYCRHCSEFICDYCEGAHRRITPFKDHKVVDILTLKQNVRQNLPLKRRLSKCSSHDEELDVYCSTCEEVICTECSVDKHREHEHGPVKKYAPDSKEELAANVKMLKRLQNDVLSAVKSVGHVIAQITDQARQTGQQIQEAFREVLEVIEKRRQELLTNMDSITQEKLDDLEGQKKELNSSIRELTKLIECIEQQLESENTTEVMALRPWILDQIQDKIKTYEGLELEPVALANISVQMSCAGQIEELLQQCTTVSFLADPSKCEMEKEGLHTAETDKAVTVSVKTHYPNGQPCREEQELQVELRSLAKGSIVPTKINKTKGTCEISFRPGTRGRHELSVKVQGNHISGSPFKFFVEHHPSKLKEPVDCITGLQRPYGAAFNFNGDLLVTQEAAICVIRKQGRGGYSLTCLDRLEHVQHPRGIATNEQSSCTYVTDMCTKRDCTGVMKFDWDWKCVHFTNGHPEEFKRPGRVKIGPNNKLYICDRGNDRIQVFNSDLKFLQVFETSEGFGRPVDIAFDDTGHVYVSDHYRNQILKLDSQGNLIKTIGHHGFNPGELGSPRGIFIHNNFIYVNERDNQRTSVFRTSGEFVTMFGHGKFGDPASIIADQDGFLYICDEESNCLFVF